MSADRGLAYLDEMADQFSIKGDINFDEWFQADEQKHIKNASDFRDELKDHLLNPKQASGYCLPWAKATDFRIRSGETTIHTGYNGHRKSMMLGLIQLGLISQGQKCLSLSMEMRPVKTLERMLFQHSGHICPSLSMHDDFFEYLTNNLYLYDQIGTVKWKRVVGVCRYAIENLGINQCFIDSLMKCGIKSKDLETQAEFVDELTTLAKDTGAHIHLVAHSKKPTVNTEESPPDKYDIAGSGDLSNMVDNVIIHHQKKADDRGCDQSLTVSKQRNPEGDDAEPCYWFWFDSDVLQFNPYSESFARMNPADWRDGRFM